MAFVIRCPHCRKTLPLERTACDTIIFCPHCMNSINVPSETRIWRACARSLTKPPSTAPA